MKILLADDHALFREGMHHVLQHLGNQIDILDASNFPEALRRAENNPDFDLALLDLKMPGSDGAASVKQFHDRHPNIPIAVVSGADQPDDIVGVMDSGAMGFISKASNSKEMLQALHIILDGGVYLPPQLLQQAVDSLNEGRTSRKNKSGITPRQLEMLQHLSKGLPNKDIAEAIGLAEGTVKVHVAALFQALRVNSRIAAVQEGRRLGLLADTEPS